MTAAARPPRRGAAAMRAAFLVAAGWTLALFLTGGFQFHVLGVRISSRLWTRPFAIACIALLAYARFWRDPFEADVRAVTRRLAPQHRAIAFLVAAIVFGVALGFGSDVAGGSDSYGYISEAQLWRQRRLMVLQPLVLEVPWPNAAWTFTPLGYRPASARADAIVPTYSPGLPWLMALGQTLLGYCGAFVVVPLCAAAVVWLTYALGVRLFEAPAPALWAAVLVATSPVFLYTQMAPISDVPVTAAWMLVLVLAAAGQALSAGLAMSATLCIRPNLLLLPIGVMAWALVRDLSSRPFALRRSYTVRLAIGVLPGIIVVAALNNHLYGSPIQSGYGSTAGLYSMTYVPANLIRYSKWILETQWPAAVLSALVLVAPRKRVVSRVPLSRVLIGGTIAGIIVSYAIYSPFDDWGYLRFLLPMWPILMLLLAVGLDAFIGRWSLSVYAIVATVCVGLLAVHGVDTRARRGGFAYKAGERRYVDVARMVDALTDPRAIIICAQHSGSIRHYAGRLTLRYPSLDEAWLERAVNYLQSIGRRPYVLLDDWEIARFREQFAAKSRLGALNWAPVAVLRATTPSFLYDPLNTATTPHETIAWAPRTETFCAHPGDRTVPVDR